MSHLVVADRFAQEKRCFFHWWLNDSWCRMKSFNGTRDSTVPSSTPAFYIYIMYVYIDSLYRGIWGRSCQRYAWIHGPNKTFHIPDRAHAMFEREFNRDNVLSMCVSSRCVFLSLTEQFLSQCRIDLLKVLVHKSHALGLLFRFPFGTWHHLSK